MDTRALECTGYRSSLTAINVSRLLAHSGPFLTRGPLCARSGKLRGSALLLKNNNVVRQYGVNYYLHESFPREVLIT